MGASEKEILHQRELLGRLTELCRTIYALEQEGLDASDLEGPYQQACTEYDEYTEYLWNKRSYNGR